MNNSRAMHETNNEITNHRLNQGDVVELTLDGASYKCFVIESDSENTVLVPIQSDNCNLAINKGTSVKMQTNNGMVDFIVSAQTNIPGIIGTLRTTGPAINKREYYRIELDFKIEITVDRVNWYQVDGKNISESGLLANSKPLINMSSGQEIYLRIFLPDHLPFEAKGVVIRVANTPTNLNNTQQMLVIRFTELPVNAKHMLVQFIYQFQTKAARYRV